MLNDYLKSPRDVRLELAERAKAERLRQNLTQEALAHAAGISPVSYTHLRAHATDSALFPEPPVHSLFEAAPRERKRARRPDAS